jgi:teichuronic acid biosynthesis glycosyltransferase TuaG
MAPQCSVIIPVYNRETYIQRTLDSVLHQTFQDIELIVVDDGSTDGSYDIVLRAAQQDPRVHPFRNDKNMGVAETRNRGIRQATGEYIALLDSDDIWLENKLHTQMNHIREKGCRLAYCGYGFFDKDGHRIGNTFQVPPTVNVNQLLKRNVISCSTVLGERSLFLAHPFDKVYYHEDLVAWISMLQECGEACGIDEELAEITIMKSSKSGDKWRCAKQRWRVYRDHLRMGGLRSLYYFVHYAFFSVVKYRPMRRDL